MTFSATRLKTYQNQTRSLICSQQPSDLTIRTLAYVPNAGLSHLTVAYHLGISEITTTLDKKEV
jgi:hypothetical protein